MRNTSALTAIACFMAAEQVATSLEQLDQVAKVSPFLAIAAGVLLSGVAITTKSVGYYAIWLTLAEFFRKY